MKNAKLSNYFRFMSAVLGPDAVEPAEQEQENPILEKAMDRLNNMSIFTGLRLSGNSRTHEKQKVDLMEDMGIGLRLSGNSRTHEEQKVDLMDDMGIEKNF